MAKKGKKKLNKNTHIRVGEPIPAAPKNLPLKLGKTKTLTKSKPRRMKGAGGRTSAYVETNSVIEDKAGNKYKRRNIQMGQAGCSTDWQRAKNYRRGVFEQGGKGDAEKIGDRQKFNKNFNEIDWGAKKEKSKNGVPIPKKTKKVYK